MVLCKRFSTPKDAEKAMTQKEESHLAFSGAAAHVPVDVHDDHSSDVLSEGIEGLAISNVRTLGFYNLSKIHEFIETF